MHWLDRAKRTLATASFLNARKKAHAPLSPQRLRFEELEPRLAMSHVAQGLVDAPQTYSGALSGKIVFTSAGHGWQWNSSLNRYATDRPEYQLVEDFGTQEQLTFYADYLLRAGATVVPMRPVGRQINEVVLDNDSAGVTYTGSWSDSTTASSAPKYYDEDYGAVADSVRYRNSGISATETATATYTPSIPQAGFYPVYTWVASGTNRTNQLYKINHTGGQTQIRVDHRLVGRGWVYLGTYHFNTGSSTTEGSVVISNQSTDGGSVVIADAIRFGNGIGDSTVSGGPSPSGYPREDENSWHWIARMVGQGTIDTVPPIPTPLEEAIGSGTSNVSAPSNMAQWMYSGAFGDAVYVGFHSNGTTGDPNTATGRGARGLITSGGTPHQSDLALFLGRQINQDMQALPGVFEYNWSTGSTHTYTSSFGEIDLGAGAEMDATIIEVAFHDRIDDGALLRDPRARDQMARSTYQGTLEYFDAWGNLNAPASLPTPPTNVRVVSGASGAVTLNWSAGPSTPAGVYGAAATGYKVYASIDGYGFDGGTVVAGASTTLIGFDPTKPYYFRVAATNTGGESKPSEVVTALPSGGVKQVLIVSGFDRHDRAQDFDYPYAHTGDGVVDRVWTRYNNSFDYVVQAHSAIHASKPGVHVASTSNEAVISGAVNLTDYDTVVWILGNEGGAAATAPVSRSLDATEQTKLTQFIGAGGNLFISGSDIAWDLDQQNNGRTFYESTLKGNFVGDDAGTYTASADAGGIFAGLSSFALSNGSAFSSLDSQTYNVDVPDVIAPQAGAVSALTYSGGTGGTAAIQVAGTGGAGSIVMFGFPLEGMTNATRRQQAMGRILDFFGVATPAPAIDIQMHVDGQDADSPPGPTLAAGGSATFTYVVTNPGNVPLSSVAVTDDNGTPGSTADDFNPVFSGGDTNSNNQLDVGETWTYSATRTIVAGQYSNVGSVAAVGNATNVSDTDAANYFGSAPGVDIETQINGDDADSPPGANLLVGSTANFTYIVSNAGNVPLGSVAVTDDNGTPGDSGDDISAVYSSGDANSNSLLDLGETWTYTASRVVTAGQFTNVGRASGQDSISQVVSANDPANHFGVLPDNADFNDDTIVDAADYILWRLNDGLASGATHSQGDANHDGAVNSTDYDIWRSQFGTTPAGSGAGAAMFSGTTASTNLIGEPAAPVASSSVHDAALTALVNEEARQWPARHERAVLARQFAPRLNGTDWAELLSILCTDRSHEPDANPTESSRRTTEANAARSDVEAPFQSSWDSILGSRLARRLHSR